MALLSDIFSSINGDPNANPLFDNGGQQGALGKFGNNLISLANPEAGNSLANYRKVNAEAQTQQALAQLSPKLQSGEITPEQYLMEIAKYDPVAARQLALRKSGVDAPSNIQEWAAFQQMTPEQRAQYLGMKRASQVVNLGGTQAVLNPTGGIKEEYDVTLKPEDQPANAGAKAQSTARGTEVGKVEAGQDKKAIQAPATLDLLERAENLLPQATSGGMATNARDIAGYFGEATDGSTADSELDVIGAALVAGVPRMEGPQSDYDVSLYSKAAGDLANSKKPVKVRQAAIKTMRDLQEKYAGGASAAPKSGGIKEGATATNPKTGAKRVYREGKWQPL